jgi:hypothetical protein
MPILPFGRKQNQAVQLIAESQLVNEDQMISRTNCPKSRAF